MPLKLGSQDVTLKLGSQDVTAYLGAESVSAFDPTTISGLVAYWDAQTTSSWDVDTGVSEWRDLSGNDHTLTQAVGNNQPALSFINGKRAFDFDGSNDYLEAASTVLTATSSDSWTSLGVTQIANSEQGRIWTNESSGAGYGIISATTIYRVMNGGALGGSSATKADDVPQVWTVTSEGSGGLSQQNWRLDGVASSPASYSGSVNAASQNLNVGRAPGNNNAGSLLDGLVGAILIYDRLLTAEEIGTLEQWLGGRWGVTVA